MKVDLGDFRAAYVAEVEEHLASTQALLLEVEAAVKEHRSSPRELRELMRLLHTVKGLSSMVAVEPVVVIAHRMETILREVNRAGGRVTPRAVEVMVAGARAIEERVRAVDSGKEVPVAPASLLEELEAVEVAYDSAIPVETPPLDPALVEKLSASEREQIFEGLRRGDRLFKVDFAPSPEKSAGGLTITSVRQRLARRAEIVRVLPLSVPASGREPGGLLFAIYLLTPSSGAEVASFAELPPDAIQELSGSSQVAPPATTEAIEAAAVPVSEAEPHVRGSLRVDVFRVDDAIEKLSSLIVTRARLVWTIASLRGSGADTRELEAIAHDMSRQLRDLRASILRIRMVPVTTVLERLPLVVRALSRTTQKQVRLLMDTGASELDKAVGEQIFPVLVHLVRNAVDHGLEAPDARVRAGKPPVGTVRVSASPPSNRFVELRLEDDGRGIDRAVVARKAGVPVPADDRELLDILCTPGFSTREQADTTSGRGVGMDVARNVVVDVLGGELLLESVPGEKTVFILRVPLTIAIVDAFVLESRGQRMAVPVQVVDEIVELEALDLVRGPQRGPWNVRLFARRDETIALVDLGDVMGMPAEGATPPRHALVLRRGQKSPIAFAIDRIVGQQEAVVRSLSDPLVAVTGVGGSTDLGDGRATLVIDLPSLSALVSEPGLARKPAPLLAERAS